MGLYFSGSLLNCEILYILVLHCMLTLLTGIRVASAAQVGGSYYLNCAGTCSAIASELEKL